MPDPVLVTGAASGMGRLLARKHARAGAEVAALDLDAAGLGSLAAEVPGIHPFEVDITDTAAVREAVKRAIDTIGTPRRVYSCAALGHTDLIEETPAERTTALMAVNYGGTVNTIDAVLPTLLEARRGHLVIFASLAGWVPSTRVGPYGATKAAVRMYAEVLAHEVEDRGVDVSIVCPPAVQTPLLDDMPGVHAGLKYLPALTPQQAVEDIEAQVDRGRLWVVPGRGWRAMIWMRRFAPGLQWWTIKKLVG